MQLDFASFTHPGGHMPNQDAARVLEHDGCLLAVVCDGLGGMMGGEVAANLCADALVETLKPLVLASRDEDLKRSEVNEGSDKGETGLRVKKEDMRETGTQAKEENAVPPAPSPASALLDAHTKLLELQASNPGLVKTRTTGALFLLQKNGALTWASSGDSRVYVFKQGEISSISTDDSAGQAAFERGDTDREGIRLWDGRGRLTACLGDERVPVPHEGTAQLAGGDALLVCSDGFWECVYDLEIATDLLKTTHAADWLTLMLIRLAQRSFMAGDNLTAVVCRILD